MYNLTEHRLTNGKYEVVKTWLFNLPYPICKAKKRELEGVPQMAKTFFKITKNK
jgi:hypothetical protein